MKIVLIYLKSKYYINEIYLYNIFLFRQKIKFNKNNSYLLYGLKSFCFLYYKKFNLTREF